MKLQMYSSLDIGMSKQSGMMGGGGGELDEVKRMLVETNPFLLALTVIVSCLHSAFEMLAFKNGMSFVFMRMKKKTRKKERMSFLISVNEVTNTICCTLNFLDAMKILHSGRIRKEREACRFARSFWILLNRSLCSCT
jgi:hypothetical protein